MAPEIEVAMIPATLRTMVTERPNVCRFEHIRSNRSSMVVLVWLRMASGGLATVTEVAAR